jgi:flagellar hook-associated protein 2
MSSTISFSGVSSGLDTAGIIDALVKVEQQPLTALQKKSADNTTAQSTLSSFKSKLATLQAASKALQDSSGFASAKATSTDSSIVATVTGVAGTGAFDVNVTQVAKEQRTYSNTFASNTDALGQSGTLKLQVGSGSQVSIDVSSGDSLATIAANINTSGARVSASVLYDGSTYRLQVRGLDTGASNAVSFNETGVSLGLTTPANTFQAAQDAKIQVDGITVTRSTNQITGVIPGVTLAITKPTTSAATIQVASDSSALQTKIQSFVSAYNAVVDAGHSAAGFGTVKASSAVLTGDFAIRSTLDTLSGLVGNNVAGTSGLYTTLGSVGINSTQDGHLSFDSTKFSTAVTADAATVAKLFVTDTGTGATGIMKGFVTGIDRLANDSGNILTARIDAFTADNKRLTDEEDRLQTQIDAYTQRLKDQFTQMELLVSKYKDAGNALASITTSTSSKSG